MSRLTVRDRHDIADYLTIVVQHLRELSVGHGYVKQRISPELRETLRRYAIRAEQLREKVKP